MSPAETWLFLLLCFCVLYAAFVGGGKIVDRILDLLWGDRSLRPVYRRERALRVMESWCPCEEDHDYHADAGQILSVTPGPAPRVADVALEHQPREHSVLCSRCLSRRTWNVSGYCDTCENREKESS